jgi:rhodanese-related sulfurtransferase
MSTPGGDGPVNASRMIQEARKEIPEVSAPEVKRALDNGQVDLIIDVREPDEWSRGHIPGAVHAPRGMLEWYADPDTADAMPEITSRPDARIVVQCASGSRSLLAAQTLKRMGYANVSSMLGGFDDWTLHGYPVESGDK